MTSPDHDESKPRRRWPTYLAVVLVLSLVVYPISYGPVDVVAHRVNEEAFYKTVMLFYRPLDVAVEATGARDLFDAYAESCHRVTNTPQDPMAR